MMYVNQSSWIWLGWVVSGCHWCSARLSKSVDERKEAGRWRDC